MMVEGVENGADLPCAAPAETMSELTRRETELERLNQRLKDLDRAKAEFFANVSRAFRVPLTLLLGPLQDILDSPASGLAPGSRAVLDVAQRNALKLLKLVDTLTDLSDAGDGRAGAACEPTDLASFTKELAGTFHSVCDQAGLSFIVDCPPQPERVYVQRDVWEKIVVNLVANALKVTAQGTIEVRLRIQDGNAQLIVRDAGPAISERDLPRIFDPFHGAAGVRATSSNNFVFGLPLVRELVKLHNGSIDVQSEVGRGSTFTVLLPLGAPPSSACSSSQSGFASSAAATAIPVSGFFADTLLGSEEAEAPADARVSASRAVLRNRGRVVIVDDNSDMRAYLSHMLGAAGFEVEALPDGTAALAACQARPHDAVVSDVLMPGMDGFELISRLRADERTAVIPVLLLSARAGEDSRIDGLAAGADDYLVKPLGRRELVARVDGAVRLARLRRESARREQADLEALFSMAPDGVIVVGPSGRILTANERAQRLFGYSLRELLELQVEALIPESHWAAHVGHRDTAVQAPDSRRMSPIQELRGTRGDGSEFNAEIGLGPLQFKNQACTIAVVRDVTERKKLEIERAEQEKRFRNLSRRLVEVQEIERQKLSTELHDRTSPNLAAIQINLRMLSDLLSARGTEDIRALLDDTAGLIADTTGSIREISSNLRPTVLDDGGFLPAVSGYARQFVKRTGIAVHLEAKELSGPLTSEAQSSLFRIIQEALTNCAKHARAKNVTMRLNADGNLFSLMIADDGVGFDSETQSLPGLGLLTMRERAEFAGGNFSLETKPGRGTLIQVVIGLCSDGDGKGDRPFKL